MRRSSCDPQNPRSCCGVVIPPPLSENLDERPHPWRDFSGAFADNARVAKHRRRAWRAQAFPWLVEPLDAVEQPARADLLPHQLLKQVRRQRSSVEPGNLPPAAAEWADALGRPETRRA